MSEPAFRYSPLIIGVYRGLLFIPLIIFLTGAFQSALISLVLLLGGGLLLRPLLVRSGLYGWYCDRFEARRSARNHRAGEKRAAEMTRKMRDDRYRRSREQDPRLPKNW